MTLDPKAAREARARRLAYAKEHLRCPYCKRELERWDLPPHPFSTWSAEYVYICTSEECSYYKEGVKRIAEQGTPGGAYRFVYDPSRDWCGPMAARVPPRSRD